MWNHFVGHTAYIDKKFGIPINISCRKNTSKGIWCSENLRIMSAFKLHGSFPYEIKSNSMQPGFISISWLFLLLFAFYFPFPLLFSLLFPFTSFSSFFQQFGFQQHYNWLLAQVNVMIYHQNLINFLNFLPTHIQCTNRYLSCQYHLLGHYLLHSTIQNFHHFQIHAYFLLSNCSTSLLKLWIYESLLFEKSNQQIGIILWIFYPKLVCP